MVRTDGTGGEAKGPLLMIAASAAFTAMICIVKIARTWDFGSLELMGWRSFVAIPILLVVSRAWRIQRVGRLVARCGFGFCAMFCFYSASEGLGIAELSILTKLQPLLIAFLAPLIYGASEQPGRGVWMALALGAVGTVVLVSPSLGAEPVVLRSLLAGAGAACFSAFAHLALRGLKEEDPQAVVFWFQLAIGAAVGAAVWLLPTALHTPTGSQLLPLMGIGVFALVGQLLMTRAYAAATAPRVSTAGYVAPLLGFVADAVVFGRTPSLTAAVGGVLIIASGWVLLRGSPPR